MLAAEALRAFLKDESGDLADMGGLLIADFLARVRALTSPKKS